MTIVEENSIPSPEYLGIGPDAKVTVIVNCG